MTTVEVVAAAGARLGEGPVWDAVAGALYWVDIDRHEIHYYREDSGDNLFVTLAVPVGAVAPCRSGGLVAAVGRSFALIASDGTMTRLATVDSGDRMNDGAVDPGGRFLAGTMRMDRTPGAALYRLDPDGTVSTLLRSVAISNGLGWSPDGGRMFYVDTPTRRIDVFDYDVATGVLTDRRPFVDIGDLPGNPDGLAVDVEGGVWVALARGGTVRRFDPDGVLDAVLHVGTAWPTSCAFGGADLGTLYVTTHGAADDARAGALLAARPGIVGLPPTAFAG